MQSSSSSQHAPRGRRPSGFVVRDPAPGSVGAPVDWSAWYLTDEEDMGESCEQGEIIRLLLSLLGELAVERAWPSTLCAGNQFFAWVREEPLVRVSPDVYLLDDPPPPPRPKMWQTWLAGHKAPRWAVEVVSDEWKKDYDDGPPKYAQLGTRELVIFDPEAAVSAEQREPRVPLQVYRRDADGAFVRVYRGDGPALSEELGCYLVILREGATARLRIARDAAGADLVPTANEAKRAAEERARDLEERVRALEAELAKRQGG